MKKSESIGSKVNALLMGDKLIWFVFLVLAVASLLAVYSATGTLAYKHHGGSVEYYLFKHGLILITGIVVAYYCHRAPYSIYSKMAPILLLMAIVLLIITLISGVEINSARRWLSIPGLNITFQSSDFAKIVLIIYMARVISNKQDRIKGFKEAFVPLILPVLIICGLIAPADLSSAALLFTTCVIMMFVGRVTIKYIAGMIAGGSVLLALLIALGNVMPNVVRTKTWTKRINQFVDPSQDSYQIDQSKIAIASGGITGVGPGKSNQRNFLPSPYSDFIFAIICEEYGWLGGGVIMLLYLALLLRCIRLVTLHNGALGSVLAFGMGLSLVVQALANMAVSVNLLPVTGLTLPMISMGGTSILFTCIAFGIILSVSRVVEKKKVKTVAI